MPVRAPLLGTQAYPKWEVGRLGPGMLKIEGHWQDAVKEVFIEEKAENRLA